MTEQEQTEWRQGLWPESYLNRLRTYSSIPLNERQQAAKERNRPIREAETGKQPRQEERKDVRPDSK